MRDFNNPCTDEDSNVVYTAQYHTHEATAPRSCTVHSMDAGPRRHETDIPSPWRVSDVNVFLMFELDWAQEKGWQRAGQCMWMLIVGRPCD